MKQFNFSKGRMGEEIAREYLTKKGYELVESNHRNYLGEIDLIMCQKDVIIFLEVKLKVGDDFGTPEEMLTKTKLARVQRVAEAYLVINQKKYNGWKTRIEAVCVVINFDKSIRRISHYDQF